MRQAGVRQDTVTFNTRLQCRLRAHLAPTATAATARHSGRRADVFVTVERLLQEMRYLGVGPDKVTYILLHQFYLQNAMAGPPVRSSSGLFVARGSGEPSNHATP